MDFGARACRNLSSYFCGEIMSLLTDADKALGTQNQTERAATLVYNRMQANEFEAVLGMSDGDVNAVLNAYEKSTYVFNPDTSTNAEIDALNSGYSTNDTYFTLYELYYAAQDGNADCQAVLNHNQQSFTQQTINQASKDVGNALSGALNNVASAGTSSLTPLAWAIIAVIAVALLLVAVIYVRELF